MHKHTGNSALSSSQAGLTFNARPNNNNHTFFTLFELSLFLNSSLIINFQSCDQQSQRYGETL